MSVSTAINFDKNKERLTVWIRGGNDTKKEPISNELVIHGRYLPGCRLATTEPRPDILVQYA